MQVGGDGLAQRQDAGRRRVAVMAVAQRLHRGFDDKIGRAEIRLADAEIDDVAARRRKLRRPRQHRECVFLADPIERRNGAKHDPSSTVAPANGPYSLVKSLPVHRNKATA